MNLNIKEMKNKSQLYRLIFMLLVIAAASLFVPRFATSGNMVNLIRQIFLLCILGYAMSLTMLVKGLDLSIGSVAAFSSVMAATVIAKGNVFLGVLTRSEVRRVGKECRSRSWPMHYNKNTEYETHEYDN